MSKVFENKRTEKRMEKALSFIHPISKTPEFILGFKSGFLESELHHEKKQKARKRKIKLNAEFNEQLKNLRDE